MKYLLIAFTSVTLLHAQGPLTPPGAPAPDMKTLQQVEPRTPISSLPYTINQTGSYYLTENLVFSATSGDAITINASGVTLDLMGFRISSTPAVTGYAIHVPSTSTRNVVVRNGSIEGNTTVTISGSPSVWTVSEAGFSNGLIDLSTGGRFENLGVSGCRGVGMFSNSGGVLSQVHASQNGSAGIVALGGASIFNSTSRSNGGIGISISSGSIANSTSYYNGEYGISAYASSVTNLTSNNNGQTGISAELGSVSNATCYDNLGHGISAVSVSIANANCSYNDVSGISAVSGSLTNSRSSSNGLNGISANSGSVTHCTASSNTSTDINAVSAVIAFCQFVTSSITGSSRTGNFPSP